MVAGPLPRAPSVLPLAPALAGLVALGACRTGAPSDEIGSPALAASPDARDEPRPQLDPTPPPKRPEPSPEELEARMQRIADDTVERMIGAEAVPQLPYDAELETQRAAYSEARIEEVTIGSSGLRLEAWMVKPPEDVEFRGTVLALHPWQSNRAFALERFGFLLEYGYQLFIPDARSNVFIENPDAFNAYVKEDLEDLDRVMTHLKGRNDVGPLAVYGCAWGGLKSILLAASEPRIRAVIADAPTLHYGLILVDFMNKMPPSARNDWSVVSRFIEMVSNRLEDRMGYDIDDYDPRDAVVKLSPRPLLLIHGEDDNFVPIQVSEEIFAAAKEPKTFLRGDAFGHCSGMQKSPGRYVAGVAVFLERALPDPRARRGR